MDQLKHHFQQVLGKKTPTRQDLVELKHEAQHHNPQISNELAHILEDTSFALSPYKVQNLQKIYKKHF